MTNARYRASINGFWCHNETWDDAGNWDGKHDEVFIDVNTKVADLNGTITQNFDSESELMGDTWQQPGRVQAGSAPDRGGIVSGDKFPWSQPWNRQNGLNTTVRVPPYTIWEGELQPGRDRVLLTPTVGVGPGGGRLGWMAGLAGTGRPAVRPAREGPLLQDLARFGARVRRRVAGHSDRGLARRPVVTAGPVDAPADRDAPRPQRHQRVRCLTRSPSR